MFSENSTTVLATQLTGDRWHLKPFEINNHKRYVAIMVLYWSAYAVDFGLGDFSTHYAAQLSSFMHSTGHGEQSFITF